MSRRAVKASLSKLEKINSQDSGPEERNLFKKDICELANQLMKCADDLLQNTKLIDALQNEERELNKCVQDNRKEINKIAQSVKKLEEVTEVQKTKLLASRKDNEYIAQRLKQSASIETTLSQRIMDCLGLQMKLQLIDPENCRLQFIFQQNKHVCLLYNVVERTVDVETIEPPHPAFDTIREFLLCTGDISGFLYAVHKFHFKGDGIWK